MPDNPDIIEKYEDELWCIIYKMRQDKIDSETIFYVLNDIIKSLGLMDYCERWLNNA